MLNFHFDLSLKLPQGEVHDFSGEVLKFSGEVQNYLSGGANLPTDFFRVLYVNNQSHIQALWCATPPCDVCVECAQVLVNNIHDIG
jgi:hypothetical protein